jgi:LmbE family N-acetylglucosaminyl deacetylase
MTQADIGGLVPQVRPHNQLRDGGIYFMVSRRPILKFSSTDLSLYQSIDGKKTVAQLQGLLPDAADLLLKWRDAQIIELIARPQPRHRPHIVVIEPHMDDAVLSAGGRMLNRRGKSRITILSVVKWSNFTSYLLQGRNISDLATVTSLRQQESELAAQLLGAEYRCLEWSDSPIRLFPSAEWSEKTIRRFTSAPQAFVKLCPHPEDVTLLAEQLFKAITELVPDELWIPMGLGDHIDHRMTRSACLRMLADHREWFSGKSISMYEDLPYALSNGHAVQIRKALNETGASLFRRTEDVSDVFEEKLRLSSVYASQFKPSYMEPALRKFGEAESGVCGKFSEAFHELVAVSSVPNEPDLSRECDGLRILQSEAKKLTSADIKFRRMTVIALPSGQIGQWQNIQRSLAESFPNSTFCIYASSEVAWQIESADMIGFALHIVRSGKIAWLRWLGVALREIRFQNPVICLWRGAYAGQPLTIFKRVINFSIRTLFPFRQVLFARALWDFCCMLDQEQLHKSDTAKVILDQFQVA